MKVPPPGQTGIELSRLALYIFPNGYTEWTHVWPVGGHIHLLNLVEVILIRWTKVGLFFNETKIRISSSEKSASIYCFCRKSFPLFYKKLYRVFEFTSCFHCPRSKNGNKIFSGCKDTLKGFQLKIVQDPENGRSTLVPVVNVWC